MAFGGIEIYGMFDRIIMSIKLSQLTAIIRTGESLVMGYKEVSGNPKKTAP